MKTFPTRQYSNGSINRAGEQLLILQHSDPVRDEVLKIINNWRTCHAYPLSIVKMTLLDRAKSSVNNNVLVV